MGDVVFDWSSTLISPSVSSGFAIYEDEGSSLEDDADRLLELDEEGCVASVAAEDLVLCLIPFVPTNDTSSLSVNPLSESR